LKTFALSRTGLGKRKNEDRHLIKEISNGTWLFAVADGMGGEAAGEYAAQISVEKMADIPCNRVLDERKLSLFVKSVDRAVLNEANKHQTLQGMGSTLTCALLQGGILYWSHVGDSRLYVLRKGELRQITKDQNMAQFLFEEGEITEEEVNVHPSRNQVDQNVGCGGCIPVRGRLGIDPGDMILLTTDGLHSELTFQKLYSILISAGGIASKGRSLIKTAADSGARDDMTLVIAEF